jgi:two-component system chemotaxis family response regulator WspR
LILAIVNELFIQEMIGRTALEEKKNYLFSSDEKEVLDTLRDKKPSVLMIDIGVPTLDGSALIQKLKQNPATRAIPIVAFGNSLRADLLQDAKEMGADMVLPKSAFREQLPEIIRHYDKPHK